MAAIGSDYLACAAVRFGAGCTNRRGIKRTRIEEIALAGRKECLMAPQLVEEFTRAFHEEVNRSRHGGELDLQAKAKELHVLTAKLDGIYDAIAGGLRTPGLQDKLVDLDDHKGVLAAEIAAAPVAEPRLRPNLGELYRETRPACRARRSGCGPKLQKSCMASPSASRCGPDAEGHFVELTGDIVKLITLPGGNVPAPFEGSEKLVAGVGFEPTTFRL
jgi:site-specific DNA recombinase